MIASLLSQPIQAIDDGKIRAQLPFPQIAREALLGLDTVGQAGDLAALDVDVWRKIQGGRNDQGTVKPKVNR